MKARRWKRRAILISRTNPPGQSRIEGMHQPTEDRRRWRTEDGGGEAIPISKTRSTRETDNPVSRAASKRGRTKCSPSRHILSYFLGSSYSAGDCCRERQKDRRTDSPCVFSTAAMGLHAALYQQCNARHSTAQHSTA